MKTAAEVADLLGVSKSAVYNLVSRDKLKSSGKNKKGVTQFSEAEVRRILKERGLKVPKPKKKPPTPLEEDGQSLDEAMKALREKIAAAGEKPRPIKGFHRKPMSFGHEGQILSGHGLLTPEHLDKMLVRYSLQRDRRGAVLWTICQLIYEDELFVGASRCHWRDRQNKEDQETDAGFRHSFGRAVAGLVDTHFNRITPA